MNSLKSVKRFFLRVCGGFFIGVSLFAPGISGSIIAIILGVFQDLIRVFAHPVKYFKENIFFLIPLLLGVVGAAAFFMTGFDYLVDEHLRATYMLFIGMVAGSLPMIFREIRKHEFKAKYSIGAVAAFLVTVAVMVVIMLIDEDGIANNAQGIAVSLPVLALGGLLVGASALIPGVSISTMLIVIGLHDDLISAAQLGFRGDHSNLWPFLLFIVCAVAGVVLVSRGIKKAFDKHLGAANTTVFGFTLGSLVGLTFQAVWLDDPNFLWWLGLILFAAGFALSTFFVMLGKNINKE